MKKILTFVFAASVFGIANAATSIGTPAEFVSAMTSDPTGDYVLTANIDLTDASYSSIATFSGSLDGAGHTISGLGAQALFQDCQGAVTNLTIDGTVSGANTERTKTGCGVLADTATGATFVGCVVKGYTLKHATASQGDSVGNGFIVGTANAGCSFTRCLAEAGCAAEQNNCNGNSIGGIVGLMSIASGDGVQGSFSACTNRAQITSTQGNAAKGGLGGIVGCVRRPSDDTKTIPTVEFVDCVNENDIIVINDTNLSTYAGGIVGRVRSFNYQTFMRATFDNCINYGAVATNSQANSVGGMAGLVEELTYASFESCVNRGNIGALKAHFVGGILGRCNRIPKTESVTIVNCANYGKLTAGCSQWTANQSADSLGGLIGMCNGVKINGGAYVIRNSANYGELVYDTAKASPMFGEWVGNVTNEATTTMTGTLTIDNCWRKGENVACGAVLASYTVTTTHEQTAATAAATAVQNLNAVAKATADYVQWGVGSSGYPELYVEGALGPEPDPVAALSDAAVAVSRSGHSATCSVEVASVTVVGGTLRLVVNDTTKKTWTLAEGTFKYAMDTTIGQTYTYSFVAEAATPNPLTTVSVDGGSFTPVGTRSWFNVDFSDSGYVPGTNWLAESSDRSGGKWSGVAGETELDASTRKVAFVETPTAPVYYAPYSSSKKGAWVIINGSMVVDESPSAPPADVPFALGFGIVTDNSSVLFQPIVYTNGVKVAFGTASLGYSEWQDYQIEGKPVTDTMWQLRATVSSMDSDWLTVTVPNKKVSSMGYSGGSFGNLKGTLNLYQDIREGIRLILR